MKGTIKLSEHFYSIQGEGLYAGKPSVFLRLQNCNLVCGGKEALKDPSKPHGCATWVCDTIDVWRSGDMYDYVALTALMDEEGYTERIRKGASLVITGGEPLLQQEQILEFIELYSQYVDPAEMFHLEIETNGTIVPDDRLHEYVTIWNVSPKLHNSGTKLEHRFKEEALWTFSKNLRTIFKFVVNEIEDWAEIKDCYVKKFNLDNTQVWLMPGCTNREQLIKFSKFVAELAMEHNYNFSSRLQLEIWDEATGV